jgi:acyl-homoserine-lactone acylase
VTNSNDSYWLANPKQPLEGFATIIGDERTPRTTRTRSGLTMVAQVLAK